MIHEEIRKNVRDNYAKIAKNSGTCCSLPLSWCNSGNSIKDISRNIGYSNDDLQAAPEGANLGLGCGNPVALASLRAGETVVDLGSGAGFDCFLAAKAVGDHGHVIGVDMTPDMLDKARENTRKCGFENVEFRLGEIENLPIADAVADIVISNCVVNLSPDKERVFVEALRVLKPGGRLMVSDIVLLQELPAALKDSLDAYVGCIAGAVLLEDYLAAIRDAGFQEVKIIDKRVFPVEEIVNHPAASKVLGNPETLSAAAAQFASSIASIKVSAVKGH